MNLESKTYSILSVIQRCGLTLHKSNRYYVCKCPFHSDDTPSLVIYPATNSWSCFGKCQGKNGHQNGGDGIEFVKQFYSYSYSEAVKWLKQNFEYFEHVVIKEEPAIVKTVPHPWVLYWHSLLEEHRQYFKSRGFTDDFINREMWGWNGKRYCLPVWEGEPGNSEILGVRLRRVDTDRGEKYIGLKEMNPPTVWGRWYCQDKTILAFAGEFDAALAIQDGFNAFSVVNGINGLRDFPKDWPEQWFPKSHYLIAVFDKKEESFGGQLCQQWNRVKGSMTGRVFHWPISLDFKDYCEFRQVHSIEEFKSLFEMQGLQVD